MAQRDYILRLSEELGAKLIAPGGGMLVGFDEAADRTEEIDRVLAGEPQEDDPSSDSQESGRER